MSNVSPTHAELADIVKTIDESTLDEVVVEIGNLKVEVRRRGSSVASSVEPVHMGTVPEPWADSAGTALKEAAPETELARAQTVVRSPMVGTFCRASSPEEPPFIDVGSEVQMGSRLGLLRVLEHYTTIYAETAGRIAAVCVSDAELVEYDQALFIIEPRR